MQLLWVHAESSFSYDDTQVFDFLLLKGAFFWFDVEAVLRKDVEYLVDVSLVPCYVLFLGFIQPLLSVDDSIVHED